MAIIGHISIFFTDFCLCRGLADGSIASAVADNPQEGSSMGIANLARVCFRYPQVGMWIELNVHTMVYLKDVLLA